MILVLLIILLLMCIGGVGYGYRGSPYGYPAGGLVGLIFVVLVILILLGHIPY
jgi:hypothetical protein